MSEERMKEASKIAHFLQSLQYAVESGSLPADFTYTPKQAKELLRQIRAKVVDLQDSQERMQEDPRELIDRVNSALSIIEKDFPEESKFLNIIISQKLAPGDFYDKAMNVICDLSNAQAGLVEPTKALLIVSNYIEILRQIRADETLRAEAVKFASQSQSSEKN